MLVSATLGAFLLNFSHVNAQLADSPWPMYKGNPQHTSLSPYDTSHIKPIEKWRFNTDISGGSSETSGSEMGGVESSPAIGTDGTVYIGGFSNNFFAINPDGTEKWHFTDPDGWFRSSPAIAQDGTIYIGAVVNNAMGSKGYYVGTPKLYAINPDGTKKWDFDTGGTYDGFLGSPVIGPDGTIYVGSGGIGYHDISFPGGRRVWAINPDGTAKWFFEKAGQAYYTSFAIGADGTIYAPNGDNNLYAINPDGTEKWAFTAQGYFDGSPAIGSDGTIYAGSCDNNLYAINPDGTEKWHFTAQDCVEATPSIGADGTIYFGAIGQRIGIEEADNNLYAINPDGTEKWRFTTSQGVTGTPAISAEGTLYFGSDDGNLYVLNPDGTEKWRFTTGGGITFPPAIDKDGTVYFGSWDKNLYAIGGPVEEVIDATPTPTDKGSPISSVARVMVTTVIIVITGGTVYVLKKRRDRDHDLTTESEPKTDDDAKLQGEEEGKK